VSVTASAPGKIVLSGEYAVLFGSRAVCMAVDRRALATVADSPDDECHVKTPGFSGEGRFRVIDAVCAGARPINSVELDTREFSEGCNKIGIGSSAALTVALLAALRNTTNVLDEALAAHGRLQGGAGSGVDIAAAVHGGLIAYEMSPPRVRSLVWPQGLSMRVLWTGVSASTEAKLEKLAERTAQPSRSALGHAAEHMADAWRCSDVDRILGEYVPYISALQQFSIDHDLGIFDAGHKELMDAAMVDGLIYKPAGAGGGDIGVLLGRSEADLDAFISRRADLVHGVLSCSLDLEGVRLERR
jgi:phosphomevalonate kinase